MKRIKKDKMKSIVYPLLFSGIITLFAAMIIGTAFTTPYCGNGHIATVQGYILENSATAREDYNGLHLIVTEHWETQYITMKIVSYDNPPWHKATVDLKAALLGWGAGDANSEVRLYNTSPEVLHVQVDQTFYQYIGTSFVGGEILYVWIDCYPDGTYHSGGGAYSL